MLALGLGPIGIVELLMVMLTGAVQLAILFLIVYWRCGLRSGLVRAALASAAYVLVLGAVTLTRS